ncbi:MAG: elongation factor 4 [Chloroflexi bacterium]|nr:elongation factor 4 [Chloroflexota bacterium]
MDSSRIRNFCIIAHIDHGKSTLADRLMQATGTVSDRDLTEQILDSMDLERERGITIKAQAVRLAYTASDGIEYQFNLIDTPGHVDFSYEVSRSLAACEAALLVVDATQGIQAQTLANVRLAMALDLAIIPIVNKIDLPLAEPDRVAAELTRTFGFADSEIIRASAKTGDGVDGILEAIAFLTEPPQARGDDALSALIFDSKYDAYKGVIAYVRVAAGSVKKSDRIRLMSSGKTADILEVGYFSPEPRSVESLTVGEVGYVATGLKNVRDCRVGDTITLDAAPAAKPLAAYEPIMPMVYTGFFPVEGDDYPELRDALAKLQLNDASLVYEPETSAALGFGFRCGFLGLLHMDIVQERLEREYDLSLIATAPSVRYNVRMQHSEDREINNPSELPNLGEIEAIEEPWVKLNIIAPDRYIGSIMELVTGRRGEFDRMEYLQGESAQDTGDARVLLDYRIPLSEILIDFHDALKSQTQGYASMDYSHDEYRAADLVKLDVLVNEVPVDALSLIVHRDNAFNQGRSLVKRLKELIPRQQFEVPIQAAIGSKVISRVTVKALRKNVLAKCYGGDVTRKRKLLSKQAAGKKRMKKVGSVEVPQEAFMAILSLDK